MEPESNKSKLLQHLSKPSGKKQMQKITATMLDRDFDINGIVKLTLLPEKGVAFRAAWLLENLVMKAPARFVNSFDFMAISFLIVQNQSCQRHYLKTFAFLTGTGVDETAKQQIASVNLEPIAERCFDLLIAPKTPIAIIVHCMQILFNIRLRYGWIGEMLIEQIAIMTQIGTAGIRARGLELLRKL